MEPLIRIGFAIVLLLITLTIARNALGESMSVIKRAGAVTFGRWFINSMFRHVSAMVRIAIRGRHRRVRPGLLHSAGTSRARGGGRDRGRPSPLRRFP